METLDAGRLELTIVPKETLESLNKRITELERNLSTLINAIVASQRTIDETQRRLDKLQEKLQ